MSKYMTSIFISTSMPRRKKYQYKHNKHHGNSYQVNEAVNNMIKQYIVQSVQEKMIRDMTIARMLGLPAPFPLSLGFSNQPRALSYYEEDNHCYYAKKKNNYARQNVKYTLPKNDISIEASENRYSFLQSTLQHMKSIQYQKAIDMRIALLQNLFSFYNSSDVKAKKERYNILCFASYCWDLSIDQYNSQLQIYDNFDANAFSTKAYIGQEFSDNNDFSKMMTFIRRVEYQNIYFKEMSPEKFSKIEKSSWAQLFDNIKNRLQSIQLDFSSDTYVCIAKEVYFNNLWTFCNDQGIPDTDNILDIFVQDTKCSNSDVQSLNIRYLAYNGSQTTLTLKYPEQLVTLSISDTTITNLNDCKNLINLDATNCTFKESQFIDLCNLKRVHFVKCKYEGGMAFMQFINLNNDIEYVSITDCQNFFSFPNFQGLLIKLRYLQLRFYEDIQSQESQSAHSEIKMEDKTIIIDMRRCKVQQLQFVETQNCNVKLINGDTSNVIFNEL